jgi:ATP synthase protein I
MFNNPSHQHHPRRPTEGHQDPTTDSSAIGRGFQLSTGLVAATLLGAAIGWLIDRWSGLSPWGMIVFLLLGFAAGVVSVMRAAGVVPQEHRPERNDGGSAPTSA